MLHHLYTPSIAREGRKRRINLRLVRVLDASGVQTKILRGVRDESGHKAITLQGGVDNGPDLLRYDRYCTGPRLSVIIGVSKGLVAGRCVYGGAYGR